MAKGKKSKGKNYVSKGEVGSNRTISKTLRREYMQNGLARVLNQLDAWKKGKKTMVTVPNPNAAETNKKFIKVPGETIWGKPGRYVNVFKAPITVNGDTNES